MKGPNVVPGDAASGSASLAPSLLVRLRAHEADAWRRLTDLYGPVVYDWCRRAGLQAEDAADIGQEVFQAVALHLEGFRRERPGDTFRGWLWTITQNKLRDHWRRQQARPRAAGGSSAQERLLEVAAEESLASGSSATAEESTSLFRRALELIRGEFEERTWQAFWRVTVDGRSPADVAAELGLSAGAVYVAKSRVLRRFRDELGDLVE
jgi:RNA polymerase sigma-70 factor (ECF subfamily)